jgi:hypothetical protein
MSGRQVRSGGIGIEFLDRLPDPRVLDFADQGESSQPARSQLSQALGILEEPEHCLVMMCHAPFGGPACSIEEAARLMRIPVPRAIHLEANARNKLFVYLSPAISD